MLLLLIVLQLLDAHCVYTENYWRSRQLEEWPITQRNKTLCGESWFKLLKFHNKTLWNETFREICVVFLNNCSIYAKEDKLTEILSGMEEGCNDTTSWKQAWKIVLPETMDRVKKLNRGVTDHPLCPTQHSESPVPLQIHEKLKILTVDESIEYTHLYLKVLALWLLLITIYLVFLSKKLIYSQRLLSG